MSVTKPSRFRRFLEYFGFVEPVLIPLMESRIGELPPVKFSDMMEVYLGDPDVRAAIEFLAEQAVGTGFYTSGDDDYPMLEKAKDWIDKANEDVDLDTLLQQTTVEVVAFGNSFWKPEGNRVSVVPISSIEEAVYGEGSKSQIYSNVVGFKQTSGYGGGIIAKSELIHFRYHAMNNEAFGTGLIRTLCSKLRLADGSVRDRFIDIKSTMQQSMADQFEKFGMPNELWILPGIGPEKLTSYSTRIKTLPKSGSRFVTNMKDSKVQPVVAERSRGFDSYVENIQNSFYIALQSPLPKLFTVPGFTEASANAAIEMAEKKVAGLQRFLKRQIERFWFDPVLKTGGYDPAQAKIRLNWGLPEEPEIEYENILHSWEIGLVKTSEARDMLRNLGWPLEELTEHQDVGPARTDVALGQHPFKMVSSIRQLERRKGG